MKKTSLILSSLLLTNTVIAGNMVSNNKATVTLSSSCVISSNNIIFGNYDPTQGDVFSTGSIITKCTKGTTYNLGITYGLVEVDNVNKYNVGGYIDKMTLSGGSEILKYNIFQDEAHTKIFGNANTPGMNWGSWGSIVSVYKTGTGIEQTTTMYAAMSGGQYVKPGNYSRSLSVSIYY